MAKTDHLTDLTVGDEVWWTDPDQGTSSGFYKIVEIKGDDQTDPDTVVIISNDAGTVSEVFIFELT